MGASWKASLFLLLVSCFVTSRGQNITISSVSLTKSPNSIPIAGNMTTYTFKCSVSVQCTTPYCGMDTVNIEWFFNNVIITDTSSLVNITTGDTFVNDSVTVQSILTTEGTITTSHAGIYQCRANLTSNTTFVMSNDETLNVQIPTPDVSLNNISVIAGNTATFTCTITVSDHVSNNDLNGLSVASTMFTPSGGNTNILQRQDRVFTVQYIISTVTTSNAGEYTCQTMVQHTSNNNIQTSTTSNDTGTLRVQIPVPDVSLNDISVIAGNTATFTCTITVSDHVSNNDLNGLSVASTMFTPSGGNTNILQRQDRVFTVQYIISTVTTSNAGEYTCQTMVRHTSNNNIQTSTTSNDTGTLRVQIPVPDVSLNDISVIAGNTATFTCTITVSDHVSNSDLNGLSVASTMFTPSGGNTNILQRQDRVFTVQYIISTVTTSNAGEYTCQTMVQHTSNNNIQTSTTGSDTGTLSVIIINATVTPINITRLNTRPYDIFSLNCEIGITPPTYNADSVMFVWPQEDIYGVGNVMNNGLESNLTVDGISSGTFTFTCNATVTIIGAIGTAITTDSATVIVKGPAVPVQPVLGTVSVTPTTATIYWTIPQVSYTPENYTVLFGTSMDELNMISSVVNTNIDNLMFITATDISYNVKIKGLNINVMYYYQVQSVNTNGTTNSSISSFITSESAPSEPTNVKLTSLSSTSLYLSWEPPSQPNGVIIDYNYTCSDDNATMSYYSSDMMTNSSSLRNAILTGLEPFRQYTCNVTAATAAGVGPPASVSNVTGQAAPSGPPLSINITSSQPNVFILSWAPPEMSLQNGIIINYTYYCTELGDSNEVDRRTVISTTAVITNVMIKAYTEYICFVSAATRVGSGPNGNVTGRTAEDVPSSVVSLAVSSLSDTSFNISWRQPAPPNGIIISYIVIVTYYANGTIAGSSNVSGTTFATIIGRLTKYIPYNINVSAATSAGNGTAMTEIAFTEEGAPPIVQGVTATRINDTAIRVSWEPLTLVNANGFINNYTITLTPVSSRKRQATAITETVPATESTVEVTGLQSNIAYSISVYATTGGGPGQSNDSIPTIPPVPTDPAPGGLSSGAVAAIAVILAIVFAIIVVVIIIFICYIRSRNVKGELTVQTNPLALKELNTADKDGKGLELVGVTTPEDDDSDYWIAVPVADFAAHTAKLHFNRDLGFEEEYGTFKRTPQGSYMASKLPHNLPKNRFENIFPYDSSRIELTPVDDLPGTDYINASYINGYRRPKAYIAAQGPLITTIGDFWRMIWEFQLPTVVMLTECIEKGVDKCAFYWPRSLNETLDVGYNLKVTLVEQQQFVDYRLKKFLLLNTSETGGGRLDVTHYHFLAWPDHGVPADKTIMIAFIRRVRQTHPPDGPPLIVHCSAGVGRTGTFITLDSMLQRLDNKEETLNVYEFVADMRTKRVLMVQADAQYVYIHDALSEYITCGDTSMTTKSLKSKMDDLSKDSGYENQLQLLYQVARQPSDGLCTDGLSKFNSDKNRYKDKISTLPYDSTRVRLKTTSGVGDYINSSHVDGYKHRGAFLATQAPLENTVEDLWRMIWEQWSGSIVMLCNLQEEEEDVCARYWPEEVDEIASYGKMIVKLLSEKKENHFVIRKLRLSQENTYINMSTGSADHLVVTQYHYTEWPENGAPKDPAPLLKLLDQLLHNQMNTGNKAITVICNDGIGRTGAFMCIYSTLERVKIEGVADIFQYIKGARFNRPALVENVEHYVFCHELLLDFIHSFDAYHNF